MRRWRRISCGCRRSRRGGRKGLLAPLRGRPGGLCEAGAANALLARLTATAEGFVRAGTEGAITREITAFMRYVGQGWEIPVPLPDRDFTADDVDMLRHNFRENYARFFGRAIDGLDGLEIEIVTWSVKAQ